MSSGEQAIPSQFESPRSMRCRKAQGCSGNQRFPWPSRLGSTIAISTSWRHPGFRPKPCPETPLHNDARLERGFWGSFTKVRTGLAQKLLPRR